MRKLRDVVEEEILDSFERYPERITREWERFGLQREIDRMFVWYVKRSLDGIYRGRWSRVYPEVAVKLDAARVAVKELADAMWGANR